MERARLVTRPVPRRTARDVPRRATDPQVVLRERPDLLSRADLLALRRSVGNAAVRKALAATRPVRVPTVTVQRGKRWRR